MAIIPSLLLVRYYYRQDRARPEPKGLLVKVFLYGVLSALVAIPVELLASQLRGAFPPDSIAWPLFKAFAVAGLVEEYLKLSVVRLTAFRSPAFDEVMDGVVYTVVAGLGFACLENVLYVLGGTVATALVRAFTAVPLHAVASGLMGYSLGLARFAASSGARKALITRGLLAAVGVHGAYDFLLFAAPRWGAWTIALVLPLIAVGFLLLRGRIHAALAVDAARARDAADAAAAAEAAEAAAAAAAAAPVREVGGAREAGETGETGEGGPDAGEV